MCQLTVCRDSFRSGCCFQRGFTLLQVGAARKELHKTKYRRLNLGMMVSASALLAVRAAHADLQTPVADILTVLQAGLTGMIHAAPTP